MATVLEQLEARLTKVGELLAIEQAKSDAIGVYLQTGDRQDRVVLQSLSAIYLRIKTLEGERETLQNKINRLNGADRVQTRPVSTVRFR